jgi:hypothetical protein
MVLVASAVVFVIRDESPGFDVSKIPDPLDSENCLKPGGRELLLLQTFMDEVKPNSRRRTNAGQCARQYRRNDRVGAKEK